MINAPKLEIEYKLKNGTQTQETITFYKQKIVDSLGEVTKFEVLSQVPSKCFDILMEEISDEDKYKIDMDILREMILYIRTHNINHNLSINLNPSTLINKNFLEDIYKIFSFHNKKDIVKLEFEITENGYFTPEQIKILNENIKIIQSIGIKIGIDDYPNNNNNNELLDKINDIDFVKIDKYPLISYVNGDIDQKTLIEVIGVYIHDIQNRVGRDIDIVIEGVETKELVDLIKKHFGENIKFFNDFIFTKMRI